MDDFQFGALLRRKEKDAEFQTDAVGYLVVGYSFSRSQMERFMEYVRQVTLYTK